MKVCIVTRSFVREVNHFVRYVVESGYPIDFSLMMPAHDPQQESLPVPASYRNVHWAGRMRAAWYPPAIIQDFRRFQPDILHLFEEYSGAIVFQSLLLNKLLGRTSKVMVYSAENLPHNMHPLFRAFSTYVRRRSDLAFVCSHGVKEVLQHEGFTKPIEVFPLGVDTEKFYKFPVDDLKMQLKLDEKFVVGYIGRLLEIKGIFLLLEMMRHLPEHVHLLLIGTGPEEQNLRTKAAEYGLTERLHILGQIPYQQLPQYINCMDVGIVPSKTTPRWKEQFGRVLIEFMSCEVTVIGSDSGSIPEVLGAVGYIVPENNVQKLAECVNALCHDPKERHERGRNGRVRVLQHYSIDIMCQRFLEMYNSLYENFGFRMRKKQTAQRDWNRHESEHRRGCDS